MYKIEDIINKVHCADCAEFMKNIPDNSIDTIITDPPYGLGFMNKEWDTYDKSQFDKQGEEGKNDLKEKKNFKILPRYNKGVQASYNLQEFTTLWAKEALRIAKPGATLLCFGGTRTFHRLACGIEDAGWIIKDCIMWLYGCLSEDTEILTDKGWKKYDEISDGNIVYSFNLNSGKIERSKIKNVFIYNYTGKMINLKNDNTDQLLTPSHKVILKEEVREQKNHNRKWCCPENWSWKYANQIKNYGKINIPLGAVYDGYLSCGINFASLLGWILSEGNFHKGTEAISIYQSSTNKNKVNMIRDLLDELGIKYSEYKRERKWKNKDYVEHQFYFSGDIVKKIKEWIPNKKPTFDLLNLKYEEKIALFNSLMLGDGSKNAFYQNDLQFLEWFQVLCHLVGKQGRINEKKMCVSISNNPNTQFQARHLKNRTKNYDGIIWSIQTNNMSYMARRNGKIFITGNSGFPKSYNIGKAVDKKLGNERVPYIRPDFVARSNKTEQRNSQVPCGEKGKYTKGFSEWEGWGTALKPAYEPIIMAMKPNEGTYAENALKWGVAGLNIDSGRIDYKGEKPNLGGRPQHTRGDGYGFKAQKEEAIANTNGRFPANLILDEEAAKLLDEQSGEVKGWKGQYHNKFNPYGGNALLKSKTTRKGYHQGFNDKGGASRFFYCAKASKSERNKGLEGFEKRKRDESRKEGNPGGDNPRNRGIKKVKNNHPTVKPLKLMEYLCTLTRTPSGGIVLDPFAGSGTTGLACRKTKRDFILIEKELEYCKIAEARIKSLEQEYLL